MEIYVMVVTRSKISKKIEITKRMIAYKIVFLRVKDQVHMEGFKFFDG